LGIRLPGAVDHTLLERAFAEAVGRHPILGCAFDAAQGVAEPHAGPCAALAVEALASSPGQAECEAQAAALAREAFDLARGPLLRAKLLAPPGGSPLLVLAGHKMVCDLESLGILAGEIRAIYDALSGSSPFPAAPSASFSDFVDWQRRGGGESSLSYWTRQLAKAPALLALSAEHPRPAVQSWRGASVPFAIPAALAESLRALARHHAMDLEGVLLAAYAALLHRHSAQDDILVGVGASYRAQPRWAGVVGPMENTLVVRCRFAGDLGVAELLREIRERLEEARRHSDLAFERLIEVLQPDRNLGHAPLVQATFAYCEAAPAAWQPFELDGGTASHDLSLRVTRRDGALAGAWVCDAALFSPAAIERLAGHYLCLLEDLAAGQDKPVWALQLLAEAERRQLLVDWNATEAEYPEDASLAGLFELQAAKTPDAVAVLWAGEPLRYRELDRRANRLARRLRGFGVARESLVGVFMERSPELFVAVLAILKAGGCYVPLDPGYPAERVRGMVEDTGVRVLLTKARWAAALAGYAAEVLRVEEGPVTFAPEDGQVPVSGAGAGNLAYVVFTSGSTGKPKGVAVEQRQLLNRFAWMWREYPFAAEDVCALKTSLNFVDSLWELLGGLLQGVPTAVIPEEAMRDPWALAGLLAEYRVTRMMLVPSLLRMLLDAHADLAERLPALRDWCIGGEPLTVELSRRFAERLPGRLLLNLYGLSETFDACYFDAGQLAPDAARVPIGRPLANVQAYVLDAHGQPVPVGVTGELCIGGAGLARGYVNRPDLTDEKFLPNPFVDKPGARIYRTGDSARFRPDGVIEYLGRIDHQVKIRGYRIEPEEIAVLVRGYPGVRQAVVVPREDGAGGTRLAAYFVLEEGWAVDVAELHGFLKERLPDYMLPADYASLAALPLTPSGKIDRLSLPDIAGQPGVPHLAPQSEVERAIAEVWQSVLNVESVGAHDNFFDLGGTSVLMVQANLQLRQRLLRDIPILQMYQYPTVGSLARALAQAAEEGSSVREAQGRADLRREMAGRRRRAG
jgi:amino acid adenylation domain-containing protein